MRKAMVVVASLWLLTVLVVSTASATGKVIAANDEWPLSDSGFQRAPDTARFALNLADFFTSGHPGRFLVYSTNWGLTGNRLAATMRGAGHSWTVKSPLAWPNEDLSQYDAVFVGQNPDAVQAARLINYVSRGGNVYVMSGTGHGNADTRWNSFLRAFGLRFSSRTNGLTDVTPITSSHPLFEGVRSLLFITGNDVEVDTTYSGGAVVASVGNVGVFGLFTAITLPMAIRSDTCRDDVNLRYRSGENLNVTVYGSTEASGPGVDPASVRLLDVAPNGGLVAGLVNRVRPLACSSILNGFSGEQLTFDSQSVASTVWREGSNYVTDGDVVLLTLSGRLKPAHGGTAFRAYDAVSLRMLALDVVMAELQQLIDANPRTRLADKVEDALAKVHAGMIKLEHTPPDSQGALGEFEGGVGELEAAVAARLLPPLQGQTLMNLLAGTGKAQAQLAIKKATQRSGNRGKINEAQRALADGDTRRAAKRFKEAVSKYKDAVSKAEGA
jgi:hypothetical protein